MYITIIITSYNYARYIARAIRSCLDQSYPRDRFEVLVVDDASSDDTHIVLDSFSKYIRTVRLEQNGGLAKARNVGVSHARGQYVAFLDADDFLHNDFLRVCMLYVTFNAHKLDAVATDYFLVDEQEAHLKRENALDKPLACGVVYRRDHIIEAGLFDPQIGIGEDVDFRIRFLQRYRMGRVDLPLYRYRMHDTNLTKDQEQNEANLEVVRQKHGLVTINSPYVRHEYS